MNNKNLFLRIAIVCLILLNFNIVTANPNDRFENRTQLQDANPIIIGNTAPTTLPNTGTNTEAENQKTNTSPTTSQSNTQTQTQTTQSISPTTTAGTVSYESYTNFPGVGRISDLCQLITALWLLGFAVLLTSVLGMFLYGGYIYVTAGVNAGKVNQAKEIFTNTITGLIIGLSIFIIINVINPGLLQGNCSIPSVGSGSTIGGGGGTTPISGNCKEVNQSIWKCQRGGCSDSYFGLSNVSKDLYPVITEIFKTCSSKGNFQISSAYRPWSSGSFHQTGKAVDFADGANDNFTLLPTGKCIMDVAKQCGIPASRVNPGSDANQTFHVHIDLGR